MESGRQNAYDEVPYPSLSYAQTHPDTLATVAILVGMDPPPVTRCRYLELGCAVGGNLIPMAYGLPDSQFVGIDYSAQQIEAGRTTIAELGLKNITLQHMDIREVGPELGQFDFIVAHGVYSWVPEKVKDKILTICQENLAPNGVAYVSYNTYPGWRMIEIVRDLMLYHTRRVDDPRARAAEARAVLEFMAQATASENDAYSSFLQMYANVVARRMDEVAGQDDTLVLHDEMEEVNEPVYFHQFATRAAGHGLQYLAEADFSGMRGRSTSGSDVPQPVAQGLAQMAHSLIELEQYVDFLKNRSFRRTLLCHQDVVLPPRLATDRVRKLHAASRAKPVSAHPDVYGPSVEKFEAAEGAAIATDHPVSKVALTYLAERWPQPLSFDELLSAARSRLAAQVPSHGAEEIDARVLAANLLTAYSYSSSLVELHAHAPSSALVAGEGPEASPVVRLMAQVGDRVTNMRHERVKIDGFDAYLLQYLDGSRDREQLLDLLIEGPVAEGLLTIQIDGDESGAQATAGAAGSGALRSMLAQELEQRLAWMARASLLVG